LSAFFSLDRDVRPYAEGLLFVAQREGLGPKVLSTFRSNRKQRRLYNAWINGRSRTPAAPPGRSLHNYGHAFDLKVTYPEDQEWLGLVWESWGGRWGGRFNDPNHFDSGAAL